MSLPYPGLDAVPFTILTAEFLDKMIANDEALADGTGLDDLAVTTAKIADSNVTTAKIADGAVTAAKQGNSGWINVTFTNSYVAQNSLAVSYRKVGSMVMLRGQPGKATLDGNSMFTLPVGYRPLQQSIWTVHGTSANIGKFVVNTDGTCVLGSIPAAGTYVGIDSVKFMVD